MKGHLFICKQRANLYPSKSHRFYVVSNCQSLTILNRLNEIWSALHLYTAMQCAMTGWLCDCLMLTQIHESRKQSSACGDCEIAADNSPLCMSLFISLIHVCILFALSFEADRFLENFHILSTLILNDSCEVCLCLWMQKQSSDQPTALGPRCVVVQPRPLFTPFLAFPFSPFLPSPSPFQSARLVTFCCCYFVVFKQAFSLSSSSVILSNSC